MHVGHHAILNPSKIVIRSPSNIVLTLTRSPNSDCHMPLRSWAGSIRNTVLFVSMPIT